MTTYDLSDHIETFTAMRDELQAEIDAMTDQHRVICRALDALTGKADVPDGWVPTVVDVTPERALKVAPEPTPTTKNKGGRKPQPITHGTRSGFQAHGRRGEKPCGPCSAANKAYRDELKRQKAEAAATTAAPDSDKSGTATGYAPHVPAAPTPAPTRPAFSTDDALAALA